jgi:hypothetical protein
VVALLDLLTAEDAPYELTIETKTGDELPAEPPWPKVKVTMARPLSDARLVLQMLEVDAQRGDEPGQRFAIGRLVAVTADGVELEISREVMPVLETEAGPTIDNVCPACEKKILVGHPITMHLGRAFHEWCIR